MIFVCLFVKVVKFLGFISCRTMFFESNVSAVDFLLKTARCEAPTQPPQQQRSTASASVAALRSGDTPSPSVHSALFRQLRGHHHHQHPHRHDYHEQYFDYCGSLSRPFQYTLNGSLCTLWQMLWLSSYLHHPHPPNQTFLSDCDVGELGWRGTISNIANFT